MSAMMSAFDFWITQISQIYQITTRPQEIVKIDKLFVKIDKWFPSTKKCSRCGNEKEMSLSERVYKCTCGLVLDRDYNSAINIKKEGLRLLDLA